MEERAEYQTKKEPLGASELAAKMLQWREAKLTLDSIEQEISDTVLVIGKTQTVGDVRATYSKGRDKLDWELGFKEYLVRVDNQDDAFSAQGILEHTEQEFSVIDWQRFADLVQPLLADVAFEACKEEATTTTKMYDYSAACKALKIKAAVIEEGTPSVKVKLLE